MIRYNDKLTPRNWQAIVEDQSPGWLAKADQRTAELLALTEYEAGKPSWGAVKETYMRIQGYKCGFCERRLEKSQFGRIEHDVEHFRPKKSVKAWPSDRVIADRGLVGYDDGAFGADGSGYRGLALNIENYLISCKTCNTTLKGNAFPMNTPGPTDSTSPRQLMDDEEPLLLYPLGTVDKHEPEEVITFRGIIPIPAATRGYKRRRGKVMIDLFALAEREVLLEERALILLNLYVSMHALNSADDRVVAAANGVVDTITAWSSPHTNCARTFHDLMLSGSAHADTYAELCVDYLRSLDRSVWADVAPN